MLGQNRGPKFAVFLLAAFAAHAQTRRVLYLTATYGYRHGDAIETSAEVFRQIAAETGTLEIVHTEDVKTMLEEGLRTESKAAATYQKIIPMVRAHVPFYHTIYHVLKDELDAVIEMETLLGR